MVLTNVCFFRRIWLILSFFLLSILSVDAQYGQEWIDFNQTYYRIPVARDGIYKLTYADLALAGVPVNSIDPRRIQIFRRGLEQSINVVHLQNPANGIFEDGEYLEFYGQKNDGMLDADLYRPSSYQPHAYLSLYSDSAAYFLTWKMISVQGRRMENLNPEFNVGGLPVENFFKEENLSVYYNDYSAGITTGLIQSSHFDQGEGWTGPIICATAGCAGFQELVVNVQQAVTVSFPPNLELLLVGRGMSAHQVEIYAGPSSANLRLVTSLSFQNFETLKINVPLAWTDVSGTGTSVVRVKNLGLGGSADRLSVSYVKVDYPRSFDLQASATRYVRLNPNPVNKSYIELVNPSPGIRIFDVTDPTAITIISAYPAGSATGAIVNGTVQGRTLFISNETFTPTLDPVSFRPLNTAADFIIITNSLLRTPALGYADPVKAYGAYRASPAGGGFDTLIVNMDQLINQFNYGETSSRAIYQFMKFMVSQGNPKYLFLVGKGLEINFAYNRNRIVQPSDKKDLVPNAGYPGADMTFTSGLAGTSYEPAVPTGRLSAQSALHVANYLNKIMESEALPYDDLWRKNILHLSGGILVGEPQAFRSYVDGFKQIAEDAFYGARGTTLAKRSLDLETVPISTQVNNGVSLITFFGHSSTSTLDFDIGLASDPVMNFKNKGKYPTLLLNGCNAGRIYGNGSSIPEDWTITAEKGAKAFIANTSYAESIVLRYYTELFYYSAFSDSLWIKKGIGDVQKETAMRFLLATGPNPNSIGVIHQMVLSGDPAVKLFGAPKPDYFVQDGFLGIFGFNGKPVTAASDSFGIKIKIRNYGQARRDSLPVRITRRFSDNSVEVYDTVFYPVFYEEDFIAIIRKSIKPGGGVNIFTVEIDPGNQIFEINKSNNIATLSFHLPSSATLNIFPYSYGIVNKTEEELIFQNTDVESGYRDYLVELDTVDTFDSPFLIKKKVNAKVLGNVPVTLLIQDSVAYYWRTKLDQPQTGESNEWYVSSFSYIQNSLTGWSQLHFPQYLGNSSENILINAQSRKLDFVESTYNVFVQNYGSAFGVPYTSTSLKINNEEYNLSTQGQPCRNNTINLVAFDRSSGAPYASLPFNFQDARTCGREPQVINSFTLAEAELALNGLSDWVSQTAFNDSIVMFTIGNAGVQSWSAALLTRLEEIGLSGLQLTGFQAGEPLIIFGRKGAPVGSAHVFRSSVAPVTEQALAINKTLTKRANNGKITTNLIGPAKSWFDWWASPENIELSDNYNFDVVGINYTGTEQVLFSGLKKGVHNLNTVDALQFPFLRIVLNTTDSTNLTPVQLHQWTVHYEPVADGLLIPRGRSAEVVQEGEGWQGNYVFLNPTVFSYVNSSLTVSAHVQNRGQSGSRSFNFLIASPAPKDSTNFGIPLSTVGIGGWNDMALQVNPVANPPLNGWVEPEQFFENNSLTQINYFYVEEDHANPVMEVKVDGRHLQNEDIVSPVARVEVTLHDENIFMLKSDTTGVNIFVTNLFDNSQQKIFFNWPGLTWQPATLSSDFMISFNVDLQPGRYELSVQAVDAKGNQAGGHPYTVTFRVEQESSIMFGNPFPNPSSTCFYFPVQIGGAGLPDDWSLKIIGTDGKLLRLFSKDDLGYIFIGQNYLNWDFSKDGEIYLPSGLYYFRMAISLSGQQHEYTGRLVVMR